MKSSLKAVALILVCLTCHASSADVTVSDFTKYSGPGLDPASWNGAVLIGPGHSMFGIRVGHLQDRNLVTANAIADEVLRSGPYAPDRSYARLELDKYILTWAKIAPASIVASVMPKQDITIVLEAYPAHNYNGNQQIPSPIRNPAQFTIASNGAITGKSRHIKTDAIESMLIQP